FHLLARREVIVTIHELGHQRLVRELISDHAVPVIPVILRAAALDDRVWTGASDQPAEHREAAEHPAGSAVLGNQRMFDSQRAEVVAELETPRPGADND